MNCCPPDFAWEWVVNITADALDGDLDACAMLPLVIQHWLSVL